MPDHSWEAFFDHEAPDYLSNSFTNNTDFEVDFILRELGLNTGMSVLDVGCGAGRHAVRLAQRGLKVTGIDISSGMLDQAQRAADAAGVTLTLIRGDVTQGLPEGPFDAVICLCEGAFSLLSPGDDPIEHDLMILGHIYRAMKPGAKFLLTALNGMRYILLYSQEEIDEGQFNPMDMTENYTVEWETPGGRIIKPVRERGYIPTELALLCRMTGIEVLGMWGGTAGDWAKRPLRPEEYEIMVLAQRPVK